MIESLGALLLMLAAAFGGGSALLSAVCRPGDFPLAERRALAFPLGIGVIGWCVFFLALAGHVGRIELAALLFVLAAGIVSRRRETPVPDRPASSPIAHGGVTYLLLAGILLVAVCDVFQSLAPPADADTLAYHFYLPKTFLEAGGLFPIYRAMEGAIPLLVHMSYLAALGIGGEQALIFWTVCTGWSAAMLVFVVCRRYLPLDGSLAVTLVFLTTPAVIYGSGSGQLELRTAAFVLIAALAAVEARRSGLVRFAVLAGIAAGFFVASKYTGLIFAFGCGLWLVLQRRWLSHGLAFGAALVAAGFQWYAWNFAITGDPVFPVLMGVLGVKPGVPWSDALNHIYKVGIGAPVVPADPFWLFAYPVMATLFPDPAIEGLRVGFGLFALAVLPMSLIAAWHYRAQLRDHPIVGLAFICFVVYAIWFLSGQSQRVRHLLPIYPLLLIALAVPAVHMAGRMRALRPPLLTAFLLVLPIQMGGLALFASNYVRHVLSGDSREVFLRRNVSHFDAVMAVNEAVSPASRVMVSARQLIYYIKVPLLYANPYFQAMVEIYPSISDPARLWRQLRREKITHVLYQSGNRTGFDLTIERLAKDGCLAVVRNIDATGITSRTLPALGIGKSNFVLFRLTPDGCALGPGAAKPPSN